MAASTEQRYQLGAYAADRNEPGLIRESDGTVWLVNPDTTRTQVSGGGGGGLPAWWTVDSGAGSKRLTLNGNLVVLGEEGVSDATKFFDAGDFDGDTELTISKDDGLIFWSGGDIVTQIARGGAVTISPSDGTDVALAVESPDNDPSRTIARLLNPDGGGLHLKSDAKAIFWSTDGETQHVVIDGETGDTEILGGLSVQPPLAVGNGGKEISLIAGAGDTAQPGGPVFLSGGAGDGVNSSVPASATIDGGRDDGEGGRVEFTAGHGAVGAKGGDVALEAGFGNANGAAPARLQIEGGHDDGTGGDASIRGGNGLADIDGGYVTLAAGSGNGGASTGASIDLNPGTTVAGRVGIFTEGSGGTAGQVLTAQGDGTAIWVTP